MEKGTRFEGENPLPEAMIQHVQSFLSGKEAARTTILSKSWYSAWLTLPVLDLDYGDFPQESSSRLFEEFAKKTVQRYQDSNLKIERFRLCVDRGYSWAHDLIVNAINIGATDLQINFPDLTLPKNVLGSQTLLRLSLSMCRFDANPVSCSRLKSLILVNIKITSDDGFKDIISCCGLIEELSVSYCYGLSLSGANLLKLRKLRRLILRGVYVDSMFFTDFALRYPCLKDLTIHNCWGFARIHVITTSLQIIQFAVMNGSWRAKFDVPNIRNFTYWGPILPSQLSIKGGSREWKLNICITYNRFHKNSWFLKLKKSLIKFRLCTIFVFLDTSGRELGKHEVDIKVVSKPLVVKCLAINAPSSLCRALLIRSFGIFRPNFINGYSSDDDATFAIVWMRLLQELATPDEDMFGKFGLKKANAFDKEGRPLDLEKPLDPSETQDIMCHLTWD